MNYYTKNTLLGDVTIVEERGFITNLFLCKKQIAANYRDTDVIKDGFLQLEEYLKGERKTFTLPLNPKGTKFQQRVWSILLNIPYGETRTYKEVAALAGNEKASRAVGSANHNNPIPIFIPCHRVIGSDKSLTGFAYGLGVKENLLKLEHAIL